MTKVRTMRTAIAAALAVMLSFGTPVAGELPVARAASATPSVQPASLTTLKAQALYFQQAKGKTTQRDIAVGSMAASSAFEARLWADFVSSWSTINAGMPMNTSVPSGLPTKGHVFVVLGSALTKSGKMTTKLERRLKLAVKALQKYPNSMVLVSGGAPRKGKTEAKVMKAWLVKKGIATSRIISEAVSASVIGNAKYTTEVLARYPKLTSYTLVSDASQLRLASVLFRAGTMLIQEKTGKPWAIKAVSNVAYRDMKTAGQGPLRASSVTNAANYVASLIGISKQYKKVLASPPKTPVLTSLAVKAPATAVYQVGARLDTAGLSAKAVYNKGVYSRVVTGVGLTGFDSTKVGSGSVTVRYTERGVTKTASFGYKVVKASSQVGLALSTTTIKKSKTKATVTAQVATPSGIKPTGSVRFYLDGKRLKTVSLEASDAGRVRFTYPRISKTGTHKIVVKYAGTSKLASSSKSVSVKVVT